MIKLISLPAFFASFLGVGLGFFLIFLFLKKTEHRSTFYFGLLCLAVSIHCYSIAMLQNAVTPEEGLSYGRLMHFGAILLSIFFLLFIYNFLEIKITKFRISIVIVFLLFFFLLPSNLFLQKTSTPNMLVALPFLPKPGPTYFIFAIAVIFIAFYGFYLLLSNKDRIKRKDSDKLVILNTIIIGLLFISAAGLSDLVGMYVETFTLMHYALILLCIIFTLRISYNHINIAKKLKKSYFVAVLALVNSLEAKDKYTSGHSQRVKKYAEIIAKDLNLTEDDVAVVKIGALLHDIGKIGVPDSILNKPSRLTDEEWIKMKEHPDKGKDILDPIDYLFDEIKLVFHHHEQHDGSGYPYGLKGDEIPIGAQIIHLADAFDAMTTGRHYKTSMPIDDAIEEIKKNTGVQFSPVVVDSFFKKIDTIKSFLEKNE